MEPLKNPETRGRKRKSSGRNHIPVPKDAKAKTDGLSKFKEIGKVSGQEEEEDTYYIERIEDFKIKNGEMYFFVKWLYWPSSYNTWEPESHVDDCPGLVVDYFTKNPSKFQSYKEKNVLDCNADDSAVGQS